MLPQAPPVQMPQLNWSYFKPEFSGKPDKDKEAHLLRTMTGWIPQLSRGSKGTKVLF